MGLLYVVHHRTPFHNRGIGYTVQEINPEHSLEGLMLKAKLQYSGHMIQRVDSLGKDPDAGKD